MTLLFAGLTMRCRPGEGRSRKRTLSRRCSVATSTRSLSSVPMSPDARTNVRNRTWRGTLPCRAGPHHSRPAHMRDANHLSLSGVNVLVESKDRALLLVYGHILGGAGASVTLADSPEHALALAAQLRSDVVIAAPNERR